MLNRIILDNLTWSARLNDDRVIFEKSSNEKSAKI
jgi:hypothetical protein